MPLTPKYTWLETDSSLEVTVDVPGVSRSKADVFATDAFLKVNFPPYLFTLDLYKEVDDSRSSATITPRGVVFKLIKREQGLWGRLEAPTGDKAALTRRRNESIDRAYGALEEARKARLARKQQEDKNATQRSMEVDRRKRQEVERRKAEELAEERGRLEAWRVGLQEGQRAGDEESDYEDDEAAEAEGAGGDTAAAGGDEQGASAPDHPDYHGRGWRPPKAAASDAAAAVPARTSRGRGGDRGRGDSSANDTEDSEDGGGGGGGGEDHDDEPKAPVAAAAPRGPVTFKPLPPPRAKLEPVQVSFTKLETGHLPAREQREEEIRAFRRQARTAPDGDADSVDLAERQPLFLKDKGDAMFKAGNYSGALNAYSRAIALDDCYAALRSNRAACHLALGDAAGCVADCDVALELLAERRQRLERELLDGAEAAALRRQLVRLLVRRAQGRVALWGQAAAAAGAGAGGQAGAAGSSCGGAGAEALQGGLRDYEDAMRLSPSDPSLEADYGELLAALRPSDAAGLRQRGDARFRSGDYEGAAEAFSALLGLPRSRVPESERLAAFSNRAACNLVLERYGAAVADCDAGLALLLPSSTTSAATTSSASAASQQHQQQQVGGGGGGQEFGAAAGQLGLVRLTAWARTLQLPADAGVDDGESATAAAGGAAANGCGAEEGDEEEAASAGRGGGCGLAAAAAAATAARLLTRRGGAAAHLQHFAAAAADYGLAAQLLRRLGEGGKAEAAEADAERMRALAEGREQLPPRPLPLPSRQQQPEQQRPEQQLQAGDALPAVVADGDAAATTVAKLPPPPPPTVEHEATAAEAAVQQHPVAGGGMASTKPEQRQLSHERPQGPEQPQTPQHQTAAQQQTPQQQLEDVVGEVCTAAGTDRGCSPVGFQQSHVEVEDGCGARSAGDSQPDKGREGPEGGSLLDDVDD